MKRQFLRISAFVFAITSGILQADSNPTMSRVYGNQFTPQVADSQSAATIGTLDTTFDTDGSLALTSGLTNPTAQSMQALSDGTFIVALSAGTSSILQKYNAEGTLQTASYGSSGVATLGAGTTATARATMLDAQDRMLVCGGATSGTAGWIVRVPASGTGAAAFTTGTAWQFIGGLGQQTSGKIIAVGFNGTNAMIGRYALDGTIDTTFGASGFVPFDGTSGRPTSTNGLYSVVVDSSDNIYVAYLQGTTAKIAKFDVNGTLVGGFGTAGIAIISYVASSTASQMRMAIDLAGDLVIAAQVSTAVKVTSVTSAAGVGGTLANFTTSVFDSLYGVVPTSDGKVILIGSDTVTPFNMAVMRLTSVGVLDTSFNTTGYNLFNVGTPDTSAILYGAAIAPSGQIYTAGAQVNSGTTTPYVSRLNNTQYVSQIAQFPAVTSEQGLLDQTFGTPTRETYAGVVTPFNGLYGSSLMQRPQSMVEVMTTSGVAAGVPPVGDILVGMNGFTNSSASSNMMLAWLTSAGVADTSVNTTGFLTLANSLTNEYLNSILQGPSGLVYVAGYSSTTVGGASTGALLRAYSTASTTTWTSGVAAWSVAQTAANYKGTAVGYQASATRTLLFVSENTGDTVGHITAYDASGTLDTTFGAASSGTISATSYSLNMGACYGGLVTGGDDLIVAYKDSSDNTVRVVEFNPAGSALVSSFGTSGKSAALFAGATDIVASNIRIAFNKNTDIVVAAINGAGTSILFTLLDGEHGVVDTNFGTAGVLTVAITGSTALSLKQIVGISDGTTLATFYDNATDDTMYLSRITLLGALDTTFNSQGSQAGVLPVQIGEEVTNYNARVATAALVQSTAGANQGNIVMAGYESVTANDATPMVMRSYGALTTTEISYYPVTNTGVPGTLDIAYNLNSLLGTAAGKVIFAYPGGNTYQGKILVGCDNGTTSKVARIDITTNILDSTFGTAGIYTILGSLPGISTISIDAQNNVLVGGTTGGAGWAKQLSANGASPVTFTLPAALLSVNQILQQKSGRYLVAGVTASLSAVIAFQDKVVSPATTLVVDPTFNPLGVTSAPAGSFYLGTTATGVYSIAINTDDTILAAYKNATPVLAVAKITADGSGLVTAFGTSGTLLTTINPDSSSVTRVAIDGSDNVVVAASCGTGVNVKIQRFTSAGATDTTWNTTGAITTITNVGSAGVTLSTLMETSSQQTVLVGYNTAGGNGRLFAARLSSSGPLDSTWNPSASGTDTAGVLTYASNSATAMNAATMTISGLIASIGQQAGGTSGDPILTYIYGDNYVTQITQNPLEASAGTLDSTIPGNASGSLALASTLTGVPQRMYIYNSTINSSANGAMLVASKVDSTGTVYVTQLNADLSVNTNFGGGDGVISFTPNSATTPTSVVVTDLYVANGTNDTDGLIYITGYTKNAGSVNTAFAGKIASDGSGTITEASPVSTFIATGASVLVAGCIRQSSNSRILVSGYNGSFGQVVAYNSAMNAIDTSFGTAGYFTTAVNNPIVAMTTDNSDRIYIAYKSSASVITIARLLENGTIVDGTFSATFITGTTYSATQIKMAIDLTNSQLIVAAQDNAGGGGYILQLKRFALATGTANGAISTIVPGGGTVLNLSDLFIDNNSALGGLYPNIYVVGYTGSGNSVVARVASSSSTVIALDTLYATTGIANLTDGSMAVVTAAALDPDRRVYLVGSNGSTLGYMGRFFGDYYLTERYPAILQGVVGAIDLTLYPNNTGGMDLSGVTGWTGLASGYQARAIIENPNGDGTSFIAFQNGTSVIVGKVDADMNPVTAFSTDGLTTTQAMSAVNNIMVDAAGNIIVCGANAGAQVVYLYSSVGALSATLAAAPVASTLATTVGQQKSGRYIVGGYTGSAGIVSAYKNPSAIATAALAVDPSFGASALSGYYATGVNGQIDDLVIDQYDYIYCVYRNSGVINVAKLTPEGALVTSANTPAGQLWSTNPVTATGITATQPARIAINGAGNILIGASTATPDVKVALIDGAAGTISVAAFAVYATSTPVLTKLVGSSTSQNEFYGAMYNSAPAAIVFAVTAAGALDTAGFNTTGYNSTTVESSTQVNGLSIQKDGKVVMVGYKSGINPILLRFYGYPYMSQYAQSPNLIAAGILDTTLWPTSGALDLDGYSPISTAITTLDGSSISRIYEYSNGKALLVFSGTNGAADTVVARVNKDLTLDTSFNTTGFVTITGKTNASSLFVDSDGNIYVAGGTSTSWIRVYNSSGTAASGWSSATALSAGAYEVGVQSNDRVILAGKNTNGTLYGYNTSGVLDSSFGVSGAVDMGTTAAISDFTIDQYDNIITVKTAAGSTVVQKVSASGLTKTSSSATAISSATGNAKVVLDTAGSIVVASATINGFTVARYNNVDGNASPTNNGSQVSFSIGGTSSSVLGNIYTTSDGKIVLVGYETTGNKVVVARLVSSTSGVTNANIVLDTTTFNAAATTGVAGIMETVINSAAFLALDGIICADDRIMIAGSQASDPYLARVFGDDYVSYTSQGRTQGVAGTLNATFGNTAPTTGTYDISTLNALLSDAQGKAIFPLSNGGYYMAFDNANTAASSVLIRTLANGALDTTYNTGGATPGIAGTDTGTYAPLGVNAILQDGLSKMLLVGTTGGAGWLRRYTSAGVKDTAFGTAGAVAVGTVATVAIEQTPARYVVAGANGSGGALFAFTSINPSATPGSIDTTFNNVGTNAATGGTTPGIFLTNTTNIVYTVVADLYDRLIYAVLNNAGTAVDLYRVTPSGEHDATFGTSGKVTGAITSVSSASEIRVALDAAGNIIVAATSSTANTFSVRAYDNGVSTVAGGNGAAVYAQLDNASLTGPAVTGLVTSADGYALVLGTQSTTGSAWIARITAGGLLDTTAFNPDAIGGTAGIFKYAGGGATSHVYDALAVNANGTLGMLGYETTTIEGLSTYTPTLVAVYDDPYTSQESQTPDSKAVGSNDATLGVGATSTPITAVDNGITFFGSGSLASYGQVAQALALYDQNNLVVAIDGGNATSANSSIFLNMFDNDGLLNPDFGTAGQATVLQGSAAPSSPNYQNQYVRDMVTFTNTSGVHKAIIAGYTYNSALPAANQYSSLVLQYILTPGANAIDTASFGGFNGSPQGISFGDAKQAFSVGQQSNGRIIVGGLSQADLGVLLGYTAAGKLDTSFGLGGGYQSTDTGSAGIYSHVVDTANRIPFVYNAAGTVNVARMLADGSGLDSAFATPTPLISTVISNSDMRVAIDSSNNVVVAAITASGNTIAVKQYPAAGGTATQTAAITGTALGNALAVYTISKLLVDTQNNVIVVAYDTQAEKAVVVRLVDDSGSYILDTTFNSTGYIAYSVGSGTTAQVTKDAMVHPDGRIIVVGSEV